MGIGIANYVYWSSSSISYITKLLSLLKARADYYENQTCTTKILESIG